MPCSLLSTSVCTTLGVDFVEDAMLSLRSLVRPALSKIGGSKRLVKTKTSKPKPISRLYAPKPSLSLHKRYFATAPSSEEPSSGSILTVDKWGVQREASEIQQQKSGKTSYTSGAPATEMPIFDITRHNFQDTLRSGTPVILLAYLPSSDLSVQLDGLLQSKIMELGGAVRLGRLNATIEQELAVALKLTQLPTVIGVYEGRTITSFVGVPEDGVIEQFLEIMLRVGGQKQLASMYGEANAALERGEITEAMRLFSEILSDKTLKSEALALAGLIRCYVQEGNLEAAEELVNVIQTSYPKDVTAPEVQQAFSALELLKSSPLSKSSSSSSPNGSDPNAIIAALKEKITENPDDLFSRYELSTALWASSKQEAAIKEALDLVKQDKQWNEQAARKLLLKYWESLGPDHALTLSSRKRFGSIWF